MRRSCPSLAIRSLALLVAGGWACVQWAAAGGVTLVTHGFNGNVTDWVIPMADRIPGHPGFKGTQFSCYEIEITGSGGNLAATASLLGGPHGNLTDSGEIFIKLDWSDVAGLFGGSSSTQVASAAVDAMLSPTLIPELEGRALAELPMHLTGHSRGASVVAEMARLFGAQGVWVDHVTLQDPVDNTFGDGDIYAWENILFLDNYWQQIGGFAVPTGKAIGGAYNRELTSLSGGYGSPHSDVHLWYHGTIELTTPATDTQETIGTSQRANWWVAAESEGATTGFHFSRIGRGDRLSEARPLGIGTDRIHDGFNKKWDLGGGLAGNRTMLPANSGAWPNLILCEIPASGPATLAASFEVHLTHQSGSSSAGNVAVKVWLDPDGNPWNGNEIEVDSRMLGNTGTSAVADTSVAVLLDPLVVSPGIYDVLTTISDGTRTRSLYASGGIEVVEAPFIDCGSTGFDGALFGFTVIGAPGQMVTVLASTDLVEWIEVETHEFVGGTWQFRDPDTTPSGHRFYKLAP